MDPTKAILRDNHVKTAFNLYVQQRNRDYSIVKKMSSNGAFSSVYEVKDSNGNIMVMKAVDSAIHDVDIESEQVISYTNKEITTMKICKYSPYIMDLIDAADITLDSSNNEHVFLLFMPKLQVSTDYFSKNGYKLPDILSMAKDICKALSFCHSNNILHRDVKPENIYYSPSQKHFVLSDFGISRTLYDHDHAITRIGSLLAPEILNFQPLHGRMNSDVYSLGVSVLLLNAEMAKVGSVIADRFNNLKADIKAVLLKAIDGNPAKRYQSANDFLAAIEEVEHGLYNSTLSLQEAKQCVKAFKNNDYGAAQDIAKKGHENGIPVMSCLYAYILACQKKFNEALFILRPLKNRGDAVALGLYGIIGRLEIHENTVRDPAKDHEMVENILESAEKGFCAAQYFVGRWLIDGESGFSVDTDKGLYFIFESAQRGFVPAMYYFINSLKRHKDIFTSIQSMIDIMNIELQGFKKDDFPAEMIHAIESSY